MKNRAWTTLLILALGHTVWGQELYVNAEAASNSPRGVFRLRAGVMGDEAGWAWQTRFFYSLTPQWMVSGYVSGDFDAGPEGGGLYLKYRFFNRDGPHRHLRLAVYAEGDLARRETDFQAYLTGIRQGAGAGLIATYLFDRTAISGTAGGYRAVSPPGHGGLDGSLVPFSASVGHLVLPRRYTSYRETNLNLYFELLGLGAADGLRLEAAPAIQLIFNSSTKLDLAVRLRLADSLPGEQTGWIVQVALEHYFFP